MKSFWQGRNFRKLFHTVVFGLMVLPIGIAAQPAVNPVPVKQISDFASIPTGLELSNCPPVPLALQKQVDSYSTYYYLNSVLSVSASSSNAPPTVTTKEISNPIRLLTYSVNGSTESAPEVQQVIPASDWVYNLYPSPDNSLYLYNADNEGDGQYQFYLYNPSTKQTIKLTASGRNVEPVWAPNGKQIAYGSATEKQEGMSLVISDVPANAKETANKRLVASTKFMLTAQDWSKDNKFLAYIEYFSNRNSAALWLLNLVTNETKLISPVDFKPDGGKIPNGEATAAQFSPDSKKLYFTANHSEEFVALYSYDLSSGQIKAVTNRKNQDVEGFQVSPKENKIAVVYDDNGASRLFMMKADGTGENEVKLLATGVIENLIWSKDGSALAFNFASAELPAAIFYVDTQSKNNLPTQLVISSPSPSEKNLKLPKAELISWKGEDKLLLNGWLFKPVQTGNGPKANYKLPVIIDIHGGPEDTARPVYTAADAYYLNSGGAAVIYPNVRGSTGRGKSFLDADNGLKRVAAVKDFGKLLEWIARQPYLDSKRVMLRGFSYGGYMALLVAAVYPDKVAAVSVESAPSNLVTLLETTSGWRRAQRRNEYGDERNAEVRAELDKFAPRKLTANLQMPLFLAHGRRDPRVPAAESEKFVAEVRAKGNDNVWLMLASNDGHGLTGENDYYRSLLAALFFQKFVVSNGNAQLTQNSKQK